jgi:hypothetical protein
LERIPVDGKPDRVEKQLKNFFKFQFYHWTGPRSHVACDKNGRGCLRGRADLIG